MQRPNLGHRGGAANHRKAAFVAITEGRKRPAAQSFADQFRDVCSLLYGGRRDAWHWFSILLEVRQVSEGRSFRIVSESSGHALKNAADVWRVTVPANGGTTVAYTYEVSVE